MQSSRASIDEGPQLKHQYIKEFIPFENKKTVPILCPSQAATLVSIRIGKNRKDIKDRGAVREGRSTKSTLPFLQLF